MLNKKQFKEDGNGTVLTSASHENTKKSLYTFLHKSMTSLGFKQEDFVILKYGSAFFQADIPGESDLDLLLVVRYESLVNRDNNYSKMGPEDLRKSFFYTVLVNELQIANEQSMKDVYAIQNARNPIVKIKWQDESVLLADLIFSVVNNDANYLRINSEMDLVHGLKPMDDLSEKSLNSTKIC